jgi:hypothetical protein
VSAAIIAAVIVSGRAWADNYLTPGEEQLGDSLSTTMCRYFDNNGITRSSLTTAFDAIYPSPVIANGGDVADVINYTVYNYCPRHWDSLVSFGEGARS